MMSALIPLRKARVRFLLCLALVIILHSLPAVAQTCLPNGDVNQDGSLTPADALLTFQHFLSIANPPLDTCQLYRADINQDGNLTPADALCIFQTFLGLPSCQARDFSEFSQFSFSRRGGLGFCPPVDSVFNATISINGDGDFILNLSILEEGVSGEYDCLDDIFWARLSKNALFGLNSLPGFWTRQNRT